MDRNTLKLIASGKYLDLNKSYNQEQHTQFIEGAVFVYDLLTKMRGENGLEKGLQRDLSSKETQELRDRTTS